MLKVKKHTIRCDLVRGFDHPIRSGLVRGLESRFECLSYIVDSICYEVIVGNIRGVTERGGVN